MRGPDEVVAKTLGGLHRHQAGAVNGGADAFILDTLQRVGDRQPRNGSRMVVERRDYLRYQGFADEWPGRVMDQHALRRMRRQGLETVADGVLAGGSAEHRRRQAEAVQRRAAQWLVPFADHQLDAVDGGMTGEGKGGLPDHRHSAKALILLGNVSPDPAAGASGDDDGGGCHTGVLLELDKGSRQ